MNSVENSMLDFSDWKRDPDDETKSSTWMGKEVTSLDNRATPLNLIIDEMNKSQNVFIQKCLYSFDFVENLSGRVCLNGHRAVCKFGTGLRSWYLCEDTPRCQYYIHRVYQNCQRGRDPFSN